MAEVIVGVDGSDQSAQALRLAAREAWWRTARLRAVYVYEPVHPRDVTAVATVTAAGAWPSSSVTMMQDAYRRTAEQQEVARQHAAGRLEQMLRDADHALHGVDVERMVISDEHPAAALIRIAADADLLVVGSRGFGGFRGLLLGSVSQQCVQHATCPVLVVRPGG